MSRHDLIRECTVEKAKMIVVNINIAVCQLLVKILVRPSMIRSQFRHWMRYHRFIRRSRGNDHAILLILDAPRGSLAYSLRANELKAETFLRVSYVSRRRIAGYIRKVLPFPISFLFRCVAKGTSLTCDVLPPAVSYLSTIRYILTEI